MGFYGRNRLIIIKPFNWIPAKLIIKFNEEFVITSGIAVKIITIEVVAKRFLIIPSNHILIVSSHA